MGVGASRPMVVLNKKPVAQLAVVPKGGFGPKNTMIQKIKNSPHLKPTLK